MKPVYIESVAGVRARWTPFGSSAIFRAVEPTYQPMISAGESRRWSKANRMGIYSAMRALQLAEVSGLLGGVTVGTGVGGLDCSERFQRDIVEHQEAGLSPTLFLQSLHSSISGQIALSLQCKDYNMTYTHKGVAFESALLDAMVLFDERLDLDHMVVGGVEEVAPVYFDGLRRAGYLKQLDADFAEGITPGEGATFFVVGPRATPRSLARLDGLRIINTAATADTLARHIDGLLTENNLTISNIDLILTGQSGYPNWDETLNAWTATLPDSLPTIPFKTACGESHTASAFALGLAVEYGQGQYSQTFGDWPLPTPPHTILIVNHYQRANYGIMLLRALNG